MPSVILVKFDGYTGPDCGDRIVPIYPVNHHFDFKGMNCSQTQFPLWLAYAITVHKCQGMSLSAAVINLSQKEHCLGLSYVAVLCVRTIGGIVFEKPLILIISSIKSQTCRGIRSWILLSGVTNCCNM
jgi:ATP-dependent DNA helicase PIF1